LVRSSRQAFLVFKTVWQLIVGEIPQFSVAELRSNFSSLNWFQVEQVKEISDRRGNLGCEQNFRASHLTDLHTQRLPDDPGKSFRARNLKTPN
jgi:hypothetical protein